MRFHEESFGTQGNLFPNDTDNVFYGRRPDLIPRIGDRVILTETEIDVSGHIGIRRRLNGIFRLPNSNQQEIRKVDIANRWFYEILGAVGEIAFAKMSGCYWPPSLTWDKNDDDVKGRDRFCDQSIMGEIGWQVRSSTYNDPVHLRVTHSDKPHFRFVLMTSQDLVTWTYRGWMFGQEAQQKKYEKRPDPNRPPVFMVPHRDLHGETAE